MGKGKSAAGRHTQFQSFYAEPSGGEGERCNYPTRLDPYGCGCQHDCAYCYARALLEFRGLWHPDAPAVAGVDYIARKLKKVKRGTVLRIGGMTDPLQPYERRYRAAYQLVKMLNARGVGYLIVTKPAMVAEADYMKVLDPDLAHIQITVTSTSDEPNYLQEKASPPTMRIEAAERLSKAGYDVALRVSPYLPELVDVGRLNASSVEKCLVEFLRVNHWVEKWTGSDFPEWTEKSGGYRHLPLARKLQMLEGFAFPEMTVCEDVPEHYEYFTEHYNHDPEDCCNLRKGTRA